MPESLLLLLEKLYLGKYIETHPTFGQLCTFRFYEHEEGYRDIINDYMIKCNHRIDKCIGALEIDDDNGNDFTQCSIGDLYTKEMSTVKKKEIVKCKSDILLLKKLFIEDMMKLKKKLQIIPIVTNIFQRYPVFTTFTPQLSNVKTCQQLHEYCKQKKISIKFLNELNNALPERYGIFIVYFFFSFC